MWAPPLLEGEKKKKPKNPTTNHTSNQEFIGFCERWDLCLKVPALLNLCYEYILSLILMITQLWIEFFFFFIFPALYTSTDGKLGSYRNLG